MRSATSPRAVAWGAWAWATAPWPARRRARCVGSSEDGAGPLDVAAIVEGTIGDALRASPRPPRGRRRSPARRPWSAPRPRRSPPTPARGRSLPAIGTRRRPWRRAISSIGGQVPPAATTLSARSDDGCDRESPHARGSRGRPSTATSYRRAERSDGMQIEVHGRHLDVTPPLRAYAEKKAAGWSGSCRRRPGSTSSSAVERNPRIAEPQVAELTVHARGEVLRVKATAADMYAAMDLADRPHEAERRRVPRAPHERPPAPRPAAGVGGRGRRERGGRRRTWRRRSSERPPHQVQVRAATSRSPTRCVRTPSGGSAGSTASCRARRGSSWSCSWSPTRPSPRATWRRRRPGPPAPCCARGPGRATSTRRSTWPPTACERRVRKYRERSQRGRPAPRRDAARARAAARRPARRGARRGGRGADREGEALRPQARCCPRRRCCSSSSSTTRSSSSSTPRRARSTSSTAATTAASA